MRKQQEKTDRLSLIILAAFLVLSTSHFMCRFDASGYIEGLFEKAWAGQVQAEAQVQPAAAVVPAADALAAAPKVQTIARNPFMAPAAMLNKPTVQLSEAVHLFMQLSLFYAASSITASNSWPLSNLTTPAIITKMVKASAIILLPLSASILLT